MPLKRLLCVVAIVVLALVITSCGGDQNPVQLNFNVPRFFDGAWDGFVIVVAFVVSLKWHKYGIYDVGLAGSNWYNFGFVVGIAIFFYTFIVGAIPVVRVRSRRRARV